MLCRPFLVDCTFKRYENKIYDYEHLRGKAKSRGESLFGPLKEHMKYLAAHFVLAQNSGILMGKIHPQLNK